jgi:hypothetical protein
MIAEWAPALIPLLAPPPPLNSWQWAEANVDYARVRNYDTEWKGPYSADYMPYWRGPMEAATDPQVKEVWVLKCSRSGGSENVLLTPLRYTVACAPVPTLYISGQQGSVEKFLETRIKAGMGLAADTAAAYARARKREHEIMFDTMDLVGAWPANKMAFKQSGFALVLADEVSIWPEYAADMLRERMANYAFPHLLGISSPDPAQKRGSDEDPIFVEYGQTDQRKWFCLDPRTGNPFVFRLGLSDSVDGLRWDPAAKRADGSWDLVRVEETAHYITPDGTRIDDADRMAIVRAGEWRPTATGMTGRRGYHVTRFMVPFKVGSFAHVAVKFLESKHKGVSANATNKQGLKTFFYEYLAEPFWDTKEEAGSDALRGREAEYKRGERLTAVEPFKTFYIGQQTSVLAALDIQKDHFWFAAREFVGSGDSGLIDWRHAITWGDVDAALEKHKVDFLALDMGYEVRRMEVFDYVVSRCGGGTQWAIPLSGKDGLSVSIRTQEQDPYLGTKGGNRGTIATALWNTDQFRMLLMQMIRGESVQKWRTYAPLERDYVEQVTAQERVDGVWKFRKGCSQDHLWDCENMMLVLARMVGRYQNDFLTSEVAAG